jgi:SAM-dependent methyltransferase
MPEKDDRAELSLNPTGRFTVRADYYSKYRPSYPAGIIGILEKEIGFKAKHVVADLGSGTGLLSKIFLENGNRVFGIEPNEKMRLHAEENLAAFRNFVSVNGEAERTTLPRGSVDLVTVGQALHWFDPIGCVKEISRISKPNGHLCIAYNEKRRGSNFMRAFQDVTDRNEDHLKNVPNIDARYASRFFDDGKFSKVVLKNEQRLDREGLLGRLLSASYMPIPGERARIRKLERDVRWLFDTYQSEGTVRLLYETRLFVGKVNSLSREGDSG